MTPEDEELERFEKRTRALLEESVARIDARTRSRLNQARHAALEAAARPRRTALWRSLGFAPAAGVMAALALALVLWAPRPGQMLPGAEGPPSAVEDLDLVADGETFDLIQQDDGSFYEWAVAQADAGPEATS
jgi:hypothetical protein